MSIPRPTFAVLCVAGSLMLSGGRSLAADTCVPEQLGLDPSLGQDFVSCFIGKALGQTFVADDTLIRSISVFRREPGGGESEGGPPMKLWITRTGPLGQPLHDAVLLEGPTLRAPGLSGPPYRVTYEFDPPFRLPGSGRYAFFVQDPCLLVFSLLTHTSGDAYASGAFWRSGHQTCDLNEPYRYLEETSWDLIFDIEFCTDSATPVRAGSWGRLKVLYR